jgi:hypothetical protein
MFFSLSTPEYNTFQSNTTKVRANLCTGVVEILDKHQDLIGNMDLNLLEIETNFENKIEKMVFLIQEAILLVSTKGLDKTDERIGTRVYLYAKKAVELTGSLSLEENIKQMEQKKNEVEKEEQRLADPANANIFSSIRCRLGLVQDELAFYEKLVEIIKQRKS